MADYESTTGVARQCTKHIAEAHTPTRSKVVVQEDWLVDMDVYPCCCSEWKIGNRLWTAQ